MLTSVIGSSVASLERGSRLCPAQALGPDDRRNLAVSAMAQSRSVTALAEEHDVSRRFVYRQIDRARTALDGAFSPRCPAG